ncbi:hypothetical protein [Hathewaya massiliensis]|uniref:hypothetical protein n=1 Tax=Hathewaya massiliensis TaxID=1964382 RepID=UPI00115BD110|nr:hypothetical protein [Hathewaya massiliensis]
MGKFLKSKSFIISILCIITLIIGGTLVFVNRQKDNKEVDENMSTKNSNTKNTTTKNKVNAKGTEKKQIHSTHKIETSWVKDPKEPKNLLEVTKDNSIVKVRVKSLGEPAFLEKTSDFSDPNPFTPVEVIVEQTLDGEALNNLKTIYLRGGDVKISELMKTLDQESIEKMGLDTLIEEKESMYISYKSDYDYNLKPNEEYILIVAKNSNNTHTVVGNGYGIFKEDKEMKKDKSSPSEVALINVLTNKELTDKNGNVLKRK